jgi:hypothetical protein
MGYSWTDGDEEHIAGGRRTRTFEGPMLPVPHSHAASGAGAPGDGGSPPAGSAGALPPASAASAREGLRTRPKAPPRQPRPERLVEDVAEMVRIARLAGGDLAHAALEHLWRRVLGLRTWFYLAQRTGTPKQTSLKTIEHDGRRSVLIFTDELGAVQHQFAQRTAGDLLDGAVGKASECGTGGLGAWCDPDAINLATELPHAQAAPLLERAAAAGAHSALFDVDDEAFEVPLDALLPLQPRISLARVEDLAAITLLRGPPAARADFPRLLAGAADSEAGADRALKALFALKDWWFICNPRDPDAIFVRRIEGRSVLMIFTGQRPAIAATQRFGVTSTDGTILLLQLALEDSVKWLSSFAAEGVQEVCFDGVEGGLRLSIEGLRERWAAQRGPAP